MSLTNQNTSFMFLLLIRLLFVTAMNTASFLEHFAGSFSGKNCSPTCKSTASSHLLILTFELGPLESHLILARNESMGPTKTECTVCSKKADKRCSHCKITKYCSSDCQSKDWAFHRFMCLSAVNYDEPSQKDVSL